MTSSPTLLPFFSTLFLATATALTYSTQPPLEQNVSNTGETFAVQSINKGDDDNGIYLHVVKNKDLQSWIKAMLKSPEDGTIFRQGSMLVLYRHRQKRQSEPPGPGEESLLPSASPILTPVLKINGAKNYGDTDCMPLNEVAAVLRTGDKPSEKAEWIEQRTCNLTNGLECLSVPQNRSGGASRLSCGCMLSYGPKAITLKRGGKHKVVRCYIPAGLGWDSECNNKPWTSYGYPMPFGDPTGANAEPAVQSDAFNKPNGEQVIIEYVKWNSIHPPCVPLSVCRERGTYMGQRCQCIRESDDPNRIEGACAKGPSVHNEKPAAAIFILIFLSNVPSLLRYIWNPFYN